MDSEAPPDLWLHREERECVMGCHEEPVGSPGTGLLPPFLKAAVLILPVTGANFYRVAGVKPFQRESFQLILG